MLTCAKAMPPVLAEECRKLDFPVVSELEAGVETEASIDECMVLNMYLRTAHRVLYRILSFTAKGPDDLYRHAVKFPWEEIISPDGYVCVNCAVLNNQINDTRFASLKCKDAIVDRIREKTGRRPNSGSEDNKTVIFLYWHKDECKIYVDTSGEALSKRGYRKIPMTAPMQETLAAGVLKATQWDGSSWLVNPMCGSGTIAIEAALRAANIAPGSIRENFGFMHITGYDQNKWTEIKEKAARETVKRPARRIIATDIDPTAIRSAKQNARTAGVEDMIDFSTCDFTQTRVPEEKGVMIFNPEYGERLGDATRLEITYKNIGDFLKQKCLGWRGYVFTGNMELSRKIGLRSSKRIIFFNSRIECRLMEFEMYDGTKKDRRLL